MYSKFQYFNISVLEYSDDGDDDDDEEEEEKEEEEDSEGEQYLDWRVDLISVLVDCLKMALRCRTH